MITPMMIDEVNEHTTAVVNGIPAPPEPFSLTDLMIEGYEEFKGCVPIKRNMSESIFLDIQGEGYVNYIFLQASSTLSSNMVFRIMIDDKYLYNVGAAPAGLSANTLIGFAISSQSFRSYNGTTVGTFLGNILFPAVQAPRYLNNPIAILGKSKLVVLKSDNASDGFCFTEQPIKFKKNLKVTGRTWSSQYEYSANLFTHYYLKTGGGN